MVPKIETRRKQEVSEVRLCSTSIGPYRMTTEARKTTNLAWKRIDPQTFHEYSIRHGQTPACIVNELREVATTGETRRAYALQLLLPY